MDYQPKELLRIDRETISDYFEDDVDLMKYYDPTSLVANRDQAISEIYHKLIQHARERECKFVGNDIGYIFYSGNLLISFCVKPACRNKENLEIFGKSMKKELGKHFKCVLFNQNTRGIRFLERIGMKKTKSNNLITLLSI